MKSRTAAAAFVAAALAAGAWHIARNAAPPAFDDAWYLEVSFRLLNALRHGPFAFAAEYASAFRIKAPLLSVLPLPLYALFGAGERIAVAVSLAAHAAACACAFGAARALWPAHPRRDAVASLAACLTALIPLLYGLSRVFFVESLLTALVAASIWRIALGRRDGRVFGALIGFGLLTKVLFPLYLAAPVWLRRKELKPQWKAALYVAVPVAASWYAFNLPYVLGFAWSAGFGSIASDYSGGGPLAFFPRLLGGALSWPLSAAMIGVGALAGRDGKLDDGARLAFAWAAPLALLAFGVNGEIRFAAPALPALALLSARAAMSFESRRARALAASVLIGAGSAVFISQTFEIPAARALPWCGAPSSDPGWDRGALVEAAGEGGGTVAALALEHPRLNANNLSSLAASRGLDLRFISLGYAQVSAEAALIRLKDKGADRLILVSGFPAAEAPAFLNRANAGVEKAVATGRLKARKTAEVPVAPGVTASVYALGL